MGRFFTGMRGPDAVRKLNELDDAMDGILDGADEAVTAAQGFRDQASGFATAAAGSAGTATGAATTATTKANEAAQSATLAGTRATAAGTSATASADSATLAGTRATAAGTSATTAGTKATEASTSATNAATSAGTATTKAQEAAGSATTASTKAQDAEASRAAAATILTVVQAHGNGWTPTIATVVDGERRVMRIISWAGGVGPAPATGYLASTGVVATAAEAINVRGAPGENGTGTGTVNSVNNVAPVQGNVTIGVGDISNLNNLLAGKQASLGYTPVSQGTGAGQGNNRVHIGWATSGQMLRLQVDATDFGSVWPIGIGGNAATATSAADQPAGNVSALIANTKFVDSAIKAFASGGTFTLSPLVGTLPFDTIDNKAASTLFVWQWATGAALVNVTGDATLTRAQVAGRMVYLTGTPSADCVLTFPQGIWTVINSTNRTVTLAGTSSDAITRVVVPSGGSRNVWCNGPAVVPQDNGTSGAPLDSPNFTGTPRAPTQAKTDASTLLATTAHVRSVTGDIALLGTVDKSGLVPAINEVRTLAIGMPWGTPAGDYTIARPSGSKIVVYAAETGNVFLPEGVERGTSYLISNRRLTPFVLAANGTGGTTGNIDETPSITVYPGEAFEVFCYVYSAGGVNAWRTVGRAKEVRLVETSLASSLTRIVDIDLSDPEIFDYEIALEGIGPPTGFTNATAQALAGTTPVVTSAHLYDKWYGNAATTLARVTNGSAAWLLNATTGGSKNTLTMRVRTAAQALAGSTSYGISGDWEFMESTNGAITTVRGQGRVVASGITGLRISFNTSSSQWNLNGIERISVLGRRKG